jgi:hypothetical protein
MRVRETSMSSCSDPERVPRRMADHAVKAAPAS